jgi:hypothetical protein
MRLMDKKKNENTVKIRVKDQTERKMIALNDCQMNTKERNDICLRLP